MAEPALQYATPEVQPARDFWLYVLTADERRKQLPQIAKLYEPYSGLWNMTEADWCQVMQSGEVIYGMDSNKEIQGIGMLSDIERGQSAQCHILSRSNGFSPALKIRVIQRGLKDFIKAFSLLHIEARIPVSEPRLARERALEIMVKKIGFTRVGRIPKAARLKGKPVDAILYVLVSED